MSPEIKNVILQNEIVVFSSELGKKGVTDSNHTRRQNIVKSENDFKNNLNYNIWTGHNNIVDVDLDWQIARAVADAFLQSTDVEFGRSKHFGRSHRLYKVLDLEKKHGRIFHAFRREQSDKKGVTIIELRAHNHYTMCYGKYDDNDTAIFNKTDRPTEITYDVLRKQVAKVALASVIILKAEECHPHNDYFKLIFSILAQYKLSEEEALQIAEVVLTKGKCEDCKTKDYKIRLAQCKQAFKDVGNKQVQGLPSMQKKFKWTDTEVADFKDILYAITGRSDLPTFTHEFVNKIAYMMKQKKFYDLQDKEMYDGESIDIKYAKYFTKYTPLKFWKLHPDSKACVDFIYDPKNPQRFITKNKKLYINVFEKNELEPNPKADTDLYWALLEHVIPHEEYRNYYLDWVAYAVQNPGTKIRNALVLQSDEEQLGKGSLNDILRDIKGRNNTRKVEMKEALDKSKGYLINADLVLIDEAKNRGTWQENSELINTLKTVITEDSIGIRQLYKDYTEQETCTNYIIHTNYRDAFAIPKGSPRYWVYFSPAKRNEKLLEDYHEERLNGDLVSGVYAELLDRDTSKFNPKGLAPWTPFAEEMSKQADRPVIDWIRERFEQRAVPFKDDVTVVSTMELYDWIQEHTKIKVTREREIGQALKQIGGIERKNVDLPMLGKYCTVHIIRNQDELKKATNKQLSEEYNPLPTS